MGRTAKPPKGYYTAGQAVKKLHMARSSLYNLVERGQVKKITPPSKTDGFYSKADVDKIAKAQEAFILQYASDNSVFEKAQEEDIEGITELCIELFGKDGTASHETRLAQYHSNPDIFYVVKQDDIIVGYVGLFPLKYEAIQRIMSGVAESTFRTGLLSPENIVQFRPGEAEHVFMVIGVKQKLPKTALYGAKAISGAIEVMEQFAREGVVVKKLYGTSRTSDGIRLARKLQFKQVTPPVEEDDLSRFVLDLETTTNPLFKEYQEIVKQAAMQAIQKERQQVSHAKNAEKPAV